MLPNGAFRVHYKGWNSKYDEDVFSELMRPAGDVNSNRPIKSASKKAPSKNEKKSDSSKTSVKAKVQKSEIKKSKKETIKAIKRTKPNWSKNESKSKVIKKSATPSTPPTPRVVKKPSNLFGIIKKSDANKSKKSELKRKNTSENSSKAKKPRTSPKGK